MKAYFISAIGTGVGKTFVSASLCQRLGADYWKPIQAGYREGSDSDFVRKQVNHPETIIHPETYKLQHALSPHIAAESEGIQIDLQKIQLPQSSNKRLIVEGAGGLLVPLNQKQTMVDLIQSQPVELILVVRNYLGSINHTMLSLELIKNRNLPLKGVIISGPERKSSESVIFNHYPVPLIARIPEISGGKDQVIRAAEKMQLFADL